MLNVINKARPIGVFDSGIGGLTVVRQLISELPNENIVYFGDTARVPYGSKSNSTVIEYSLQNAKFLIDKNVKAIVVACNTASSVAIPALKEKLHIPVIGVIFPGAASAIDATKNNRIGVIGTRATITNKAYSEVIKSMNSGIEIFETACPLFVPLAEEGWTNHKATYSIAEEYLKDLRELNIDTLVLGCTHYPILSEVIQSVIGNNVTLIDSGVATAVAVKEELSKLDLLNSSSNKGEHSFYVSDVPTKFKEVAELFMGYEINHVSKIDLEILQKY
ncbi:MAG: glutamate racemase [Ignavibacteria bacterium]|jgi:glutamate racemase|nr:glutamate racemase [Ignavibacteria bacterium]